MNSKEIYYENASKETQKMEENRDGRQFDLSVAASGHGGGYCCDTGVDLPTLLALLAGKKTLMTNSTIHNLIKWLLKFTTPLVSILSISGIALATYFLRIQIIVLMRGKRQAPTSDITQSIATKSVLEVFENNKLLEVIREFEKDNFL